MAEVKIENVTKVYPGDVTAVKNVSIEVEDKEFLVLVGPSGCGKSTLLRMIAGLEEITRGEIRIGERVVNNIAPKDRDIAMVFQNYALYPHMTVYKNMAFGLQLRKFKKDEIDLRVRQAANILGIEELLDRRPKALSGGQRQRVAVGRAIVRQPQVFLFDEPLSNLDAKLRAQMRTEISKLHERLQATMIYVTHDQVEAMTMGDRIVVLLDGVVQQVADPLELYEKPVNKFVAGFIGSPPMNFIEGAIKTQDGKTVFDGGDFRLILPNEIAQKMGDYSGKETILGIRPEHMGVARREDSLTLKAKVEVVEPMGSESYLYLATAHSSLTARVDPHVRPDTGETLELALDPERL
ncbi:MAG: ABC transporter ATP-binding protein, partial [Candidatus Sumerlaeota bacterium]